MLKSVSIADIKNGNQAQMLLLDKKINGTHYVAVAVPDSQWKKVWIVSSYINKKWHMGSLQMTEVPRMYVQDARNHMPSNETSQQTADVQAPTSNAQDASLDNASNNNISQQGKNVNTEKANAKTPSKARFGGAELGYGKSGAKLFDEVFETEEAERSKVQPKFQRAYESGYMGVENADFADSIEQRTYEAGKADLAESLNMAIAKSKQAAVQSKNGGLVRTEASKKVNRQELRLMDKIGRILGVKIQYAAQVLGGRANGKYANGTITIALDAENKGIVVAKHEITHFMKEVSPREYLAFRNAALQALTEERGVSATTLVKQYQDMAKNDGMSYTFEDAMDDIAADFTERLLTNESDLRAFLDSMSETKQKRNIMQKFFDAVRDFVDKVKKFFKGDTANMDSAILSELEEASEQLEKAEALWKNLMRATAEKARSKNIEVQKEYNSGLKKSADDDIINKEDYSIKKKYWHPDLSKESLEELKNSIKKEIKPSTNNVTDSSKWIFTNINGADVFAIYSTEDAYNPTLLYESKGAKAIFERNYLLNLIEVKNNVESIDGKSRVIGRVSNGSWLQLRSNYSNSVGVVGRSGSNRDAGILQGQSKRKPSRAFRNVVKNLFEVRGGRGRLEGDSDTKFSLKSQSNLLAENKKLQEVNEALRREFEVTKLAKVDEKSLGKFTKGLLKEYGSEADTDKIKSALNELFTYMANGEDGKAPVWEEVQRRALDISAEILENSIAINDELYQEYSDLRKCMRSTGLIQIPPTTEEEAENYSDIYVVPEQVNNMKRLKGRHKK